MRTLRILLLLLLLGSPVDGDPPILEPIPEVDLSERLGPDEARAGVLTEGDTGAFIGGAAGESRAGDYLLYNDRARFVIRGLREGHFYIAQPGSVIDADIVRPEGQADRDAIDDLFTLGNLARLFRAESIEVVADGSDGGAAVVRATGTDVSFAYLEGVLESPGLFPALDVEITQTFRLEPSSPALEITTEVHNPGAEALELTILDAGMTDLACLAVFVPGTGFGGDAPPGIRDMMAMVSHRNDLAVAIYRADGSLAESGLSVLGEEFDLLVAESEQLSLEPGATESVTRLVGVAPDLASLEIDRRARQGLATGFVEGTLAESGSGVPVAGARVFLTDAAGDPQMVAISDSEGRFRLGWEPGDYQLVAVGDGNNERMDFPAAWGPYGLYAHPSANERATRAFTDPDAAVAAPEADGHGRTEPVPVTLEDGEVTLAALTLDAPARLSLTVEDGDGQPLPAVAHVFFDASFPDPQPRDRRLGESRPRGGARKAVWVMDGAMEVPIPAGLYDVVAQHGPRYELARAEDVLLSAGETTALTLVLDEVVPLDGFTAGDLHTHASPSIDGELTIEERLATVVANDVQVQVATDHDHVADYRPVAAAMGIDPWAVTVPGDEISPELRGHHNAYPLEPDPDLPNGGTPRWWEQQMTTSELHAFFREQLGEQALLQINHGLDTGMFAASDYDPSSGEPGKPDFYSPDFDTMEILNSGDFGEAEELRDILCAHLDQGLRPVGTGVSDAHSRLSGAGNARTYVYTGADSMEDLDVDGFFANLKAGRAVVSSGPRVTLEATHDGETAGLGDTLVAPQATLAMEVLAPSWMGIDEVRLYGRGCELLDTFLIDGQGIEAPLWFEGEVDVYPEEDGYYLLEVHGWGDMAPLWSGGRPYALTNPVFVALP